MKQAVLFQATGKTIVTYTQLKSGAIVIYYDGEPVLGFKPTGNKQSRPVAKPTLIEPKPVVTDLNGDPTHDYPLYVKRFQETAPEVVRAYALYCKEKLGYTVPDADKIFQVEDDLDLVQSILKEIIVNGQLIRGARTRIAEQLGVKDAGNYRARIDAVIKAVLGNSNNSNVLEISAKTARK